MKSKVNLDKTLTKTVSSFAYQDPYNPNGGLLYLIRNKFTNFFQLRQIENEFLDFKTYSTHYQFKQIYEDLYNGYKRQDRVVLQRSLSESMFLVIFCVYRLILVCDKSA